jgi:acyl dehydratase
VSETASFEKAITAKEIAAFSKLSGDQNPLHMDDIYASAMAYPKRVAHGLLVAAPISTLAGHYLPGKRCLLLEVTSQFLRPVFAGDILTYQGTIAQISASTKAIKVQVSVTNREGNVVLRANYTGRVLPDSVQGKIK